MSSTITSTWLVPSSPTGSTSSFTNTWGVATPEDTEPLDWAAWAVTDPAWDLNWALDIYVLGGHGKDSYWVHYDHWYNLDTWLYIPINWDSGNRLPRNTYQEVNLEARANAFDYWAQNKGTDPNNWLWELIEDIEQKNQWAMIGRD
ncbi:unnamed protein product [Rhizoctonia solani]|uniref:Uncharacterized protein n=1 Tax=Rhizoctonia solani TaxID=456999 RepID=A0A8H3HP77_9AGAM|nr:unnamed protein product [Rhizoctonia solani]